jgi:hypothetical protein
VHRFWHSVIEPVLEAVEPRVVVEIGADRGANTANILRYCKRRNAVAHVIDPLPRFDVEEWRAEYGDALVCHQALSLEALPAIPGADAVLIDGDHNWYTVFHELSVLESAAGDVERFPVVLLHDVDWPYGRRDLYYDPETIPAEHRNPFAALGMLPGQAELVEEGGFNAGVANAVHERTPRNGVRTAVEDFVAASALDLRFSTIPGFHGLGLLVTEALLLRNCRLTEVVAGFGTAEFLARQCQELERARVVEMIAARDRRRPLKRRIRQLERQLATERPSPLQQHPVVGRT